MTAWSPLEASVNYVLVAGKKTPGLAEVVGANWPRKWDERMGYGLSPSLVFNHAPLRHFAIHVRLYTAQDWADWDAFKPIVEKMPTRRGPALPGTPPPAAHALDVWHPFLERAHVKSAVIEDIDQPIDSGTGEWLIVIKCIEFRKQAAQLAPVKASQTAATPDAVDQRILNNTAEIKGLNQELAKP